MKAGFFLPSDHGDRCKNKQFKLDLFRYGRDSRFNRKSYFSDNILEKTMSGY